MMYGNTGAPINDQVRKQNQNLPGMGGVFNTVNLHLYHYAGNNPVKYTDPDGEDMLFAIFDRSSNTINATYIEWDGQTTGDTTTYTWSASNNVRNELNGDRATPNAQTMPSSGKSEWYFPREFPDGMWDVGKSRPVSGNPDLGDVFIPTTAHQSVPTYGPTDSPMPMPDKDGKYYASRSQNDTGYGLHFSSSKNTLGCIRFASQEAANEYAALSDKALNSKEGLSIIIVQE